MEPRTCPVFVDGKPCGRQLIRLKTESSEVEKFKLEVYSCSLRHRTAFITEPQTPDKGRNSHAGGKYQNEGRRRLQRTRM
jgi:hypothetical protein